MWKNCFFLNEENEKMSKSQMIWEKNSFYVHESGKLCFDDDNLPCLAEYKIVFQRKYDKKLYFN